MRKTFATLTALTLMTSACVPNSGAPNSGKTAPGQGGAPDTGAPPPNMGGDPDTGNTPPPPPSPSSGGLVNPLARAGHVGMFVAPAHAAPGCPDVPPVQGLAGVAYYGDKAASQVNAAKLQSDRDAARPLNNFGSQMMVQTERYLSSRRQDAASARCALSIMDKWAQANALNGSFNEVGLGHRRWTINNIAVDFLAIKDAPGLDPEQVRRVSRWLDSQGTAIISTLNPSLQNNHLYWAAAGVAATAIAANDERNFHWAINAARKGIGEIDAQGALPKELQRGPMAMHYEVFSLEALVQVAGFAKANGIDLYAENNGAIGRLAHLVLRNMNDTTGIARLANASQNFNEDPKDTLSWVEQYYADTGDCAAAAVLSRARPLSKAYLGGSTTLLYGANLNRCG